MRAGGERVGRNMREKDSKVVGRGREIEKIYLYTSKMYGNRYPARNKEIKGGGKRGREKRKEGI